MTEWTLTCCIYFYCLILNSYGLPRIDPLVDTKLGLIRGLKASDGDYSMFMGIPYAIVDENNPFGVSTPHPVFEETFEAYDDSAICPQIEEFNNTMVGKLDCLHINIYVPNSATSKNTLPVLVWIYGGGFSIGFSGRYLYGPKYFMKQNIILVTFNYRLGPYGFLCLDTPDVPGNQGLKDQQLALKWIKNNIEAFGGDPNKITIYGESAGGASVDLHLMYSQENLFNQVIMQSGTALMPRAVLRHDTLVPIKIAEILGLSTIDTDEALEFLSGTDPKLVIEATSKLNILLRPCVEKEFENVDRFIHDYPINIQAPNLGNMPVLLGYNSDEGLGTFEIMSSEDYEKLTLFEDNLKLSFDFTDEDFNKMVEVVSRYYIGDDNISIDVKKGLTRFYSDFYYNYPTLRTIQRYIDNGVNNIYSYVFSYDSERNFVKNKLNITVPGVTHADEISFFFDISYMKEPTPEDQRIIDRVSTLWANFVKYGNPTPEKTELLPVQWPAVTKDSHYYLNINTELTVERRAFADRMAFWELFYIINHEFQRGYINKQ